MKKVQSVRVHSSVLEDAGGNRQQVTRVSKARRLR